MNERQTLTVSQMEKEFSREMKVPINARTGLKVEKLYKSLTTPSYVHGYSLAIEYMRNWFLSKFPQDFFKTVYVNGKHVLDDYRIFNKDTIKKEKPMVAIVPSLDPDYDRETLDLYLASPKMYLYRSKFQNAFFKDDLVNQYLGIQMRGLRMNFNFKVRVSTKAQQLDLWHKMELAFRIGSTISQDICVEFHIPKDIMLAIARLAGFEIDDDKKIVYNVLGFLSYMNAHSDLPIMFKMRAINQQPEFFLRMRNIGTHIDVKNKLSIDDGERDGHLDNNFHIEMAATLDMLVPHFFVYFAAHPIHGDLTVYKEDDSIRVGLYSFEDYDIPEYNKLGWPQIAVTPYRCDPGEKFIDMSQIFTPNTNLGTLISNSLSNYMSPNAYIDITVFKDDGVRRLVKSKMDYIERKLYLLDEMDDETIYIVIYADKKYINESIATLNNYADKRIILEPNKQKKR